jgi:hypothetical protein
MLRVGIGEGKSTNACSSPKGNKRESNCKTEGTTTGPINTNTSQNIDYYQQSSFSVDWFDCSTY